MLKNIIFVIVAFVATHVLSTESAQAQKQRALFGDGSVRYVSAGPVGLNNSQSALIGLLLPAVQRAHATIKLVDNKGKVLLTKELDIPTDQIPTDQNPGFWALSFKLSVNESGIIAINDGITEESIGSLTSSEHVSILIGLLLPAVQKVRDAAARTHTGSIQIVNKRTGDTVGILPFIEQAVLAKNVAAVAR